MIVTETLAMSYLNSTLVTAGNINEQASSRKEEKCVALVLNHNFIPFAIKTRDPISSKALFLAGAWPSPFSHHW